MNGPIHAHDCKGCTYLGSRHIGADTYDFYFCKQGGNLPTILGRWSSEGPDYTSGLNERDGVYHASEVLAHGVYLAFDAGLLKRKHVSVLMGIPLVPQEAQCTSTNGAGFWGLSQYSLLLDEIGNPISFDVAVDRNRKHFRAQAKFVSF